MEQKSEPNFSLTDIAGVKENKELQGMELDEIGSEADDWAEWSNASTSPPSVLEEPSIPSWAGLEGIVLGEESDEEKEMKVKSEKGLHVAKALRCMQPSATPRLDLLVQRSLFLESYCQFSG